MHNVAIIIASGFLLLLVLFLYRAFRQKADLNTKLDAMLLDLENERQERRQCSDLDGPSQEHPPVPWQ